MDNTKNRPLFQTSCLQAVHERNTISRVGAGISSQAVFNKNSYQDNLQATSIDSPEKFQNRAARFVLGRYKRRDSCTAMRSELGCELLSSRRKKFRLKFLFSVFHGQTGTERHNYFSEPSYISSRHDHRHKVKECRARTTIFYNSFFVLTIRDWNRLQDKQVCCTNEEFFCSSLAVTPFWAKRGTHRIKKGLNKWQAPPSLR